VCELSGQRSSKAAKLERQVKAYLQEDNGRVGDLKYRHWGGREEGKGKVSFGFGGLGREGLDISRKLTTQRGPESVNSEGGLGCDVQKKDERAGIEPQGGRKEERNEGQLNSTQSLHGSSFKELTVQS